MKDIIKLPAEHYLDLIIHNKPFSLCRFGDGETLCMALAPHPLKQNCDGSRFIPELINPMRQIFLNNYDYYHCALDCTFNENGKELVEFIDKTCPTMQMYDGEWLQHLSFDGRIRELIDAIAPYNPCFIGGSHIGKVKYMIGMKDMRFIEVPSRDSFYHFEQIFAQCMNMHLAGCRMFLFSCGFTAKPLIDTLFPYIGNDSTLLDCGSVFDPFVGKLSRDGMKYYGFQKFQPYTNLLLR